MKPSLPILVVEDDPNLREAVCDTLELAGHAVVSADGGEAALGMLSTQAVALVVNGFCREVLQALPMEFAMEAQSLVAISLEGSVG